MGNAWLCIAQQCNLVCILEIFLIQQEEDGRSPGMRWEAISLIMGVLSRGDCDSLCFKNRDHEFLCHQSWPLSDFVDCGFIFWRYWGLLNLGP
jgi:hypothetical protein